MSNPGTVGPSSRSDVPHAATAAYERGQRLYCENCRSEIEIISPCPCDPPDQRLLCCGQPMTPSTGVSVHLNVEG